MRATSCLITRGWVFAGVVAAAVVVALGAGVTRAEVPGAAGAAEEGKGVPRAGHPRLYATPERVEAVRKGIERDPRLRAWHDALQADAARIQREAPVVHELVGPRLLTQSRNALRRVSTLAGLYLLDKDPQKLERAVKEMRTAAAFKDWNPSHFLDVAEMTNALAIGYDWLYDDLKPGDRQAIRTAIVELGLKPGLKVYDSGRGWQNSEFNWNQVCNGGMLAGALAVADEEPELARKILDYSRKSIVKAMASYAPDGGWAEGPGYWNYATAYNVYFLDGLTTALGTDYGLSQLPGFPVTGGFRAHSVGPVGQTFNYADASERAGSAAQMMWLARQFNRPGDAVVELGMVGNRPSFFHLLWSQGELPAAGTAAALPLDAVYRGVDVAFFRSAWNDRNAVYVGFKGGDNQANHSHLDLGCFVLDAEGQRWALDLGSDNYNLPNYFGKNRWDYYRLRSEGQNTLTLGGENQDTKAKAPLVAFRSTPELAYAVADLTAAYAPEVTKAWRGIGLLDRAQVLVVDEVSARKPVDLVWTVHTKAEVSVSGPVATLTLGGKVLEARLLDTSSGASFEVTTASAPEPQAQNQGVKRLVLRAPRLKEGRIAVLFTPGGKGAEREVPSLGQWIETGKLEPLGRPEAAASR